MRTNARSYVMRADDGTIKRAAQARPLQGREDVSNMRRLMETIAGE